MGTEQKNIQIYFFIQHLHILLKDRKALPICTLRSFCLLKQTKILRILLLHVDFAIQVIMQNYFHRNTVVHQAATEN